MSIIQGQITKNFKKKPFFFWEMFLHNRLTIHFISFFSCSNISSLLYSIILDSENCKHPPSQYCYIFRARKQWNKIKKWNKIEWNKIEWGQYKIFQFSRHFSPLKWKSILCSENEAWKICVCMCKVVSITPVLQKSGK